MTFQKHPNLKQLTAELNSNKLESIYLFLGEEEGEKEKIISKIIDMKIKNEDEKNYSTRRFHMESGEFQDAAEFALSASMFSESKVCVMLNIDSLKPKSDDKKLLSEIIDCLPDSNTVIMTCSENKVPPVVDNKFIKKIKIIQFWKLFDNDISSYIINSARKKDIKIDITSVNHLVNLTGRDIKKIDEAIEILIDSGEKTITPVIINEYIHDTKDVSIFEFIDSLFRKDRNSFSQLMKVLDNGTHELALLKLIMKQAELIEKYNYLTKTGINSEAAIGQLGIIPRNTKNFLECAKQFPSDSIKNIFPLIHQADRQIKSSSYSNNFSSNPIFELTSNILLRSIN
ncbi:MAG: DNA polymerase III subunit delta [Spirochaetes bacterium]|nr:DNA polymerase III subunit delta [Spirochaetota bacterium]